MASDFPKDPRTPDHRILDAAVSLFARKGFAAVGVREIAREAGVNVSMISYYYGGKLGLLKAMTKEFFDRYAWIFHGTDDESLPAEEGVRILVRKLVEFVRANEDLTMVMLTEHAMDNAEITDLRAERIRGLLGTIGGIVSKFGLDPSDAAKLSMIGPSLVGMITMHFRIRPTIESAFNARIDNAYYESYVKTIGTLFLRGIEGIAAEQRQGEE